MTETTTQLAARLGLPVEPYGVAGQVLARTPTGIPLAVLTPRGLVGGGVSWSARLVLDLAVVAVGGVGDGVGA